MSIANFSDEKLVSLYMEMGNIAKICRHLGVKPSVWSWRYIKKVLERMGIKYSSSRAWKECGKHLVKYKKSIVHPRTYSLDETYFDKIDTEEKAYWLGFIAADGCVTKRGALSIKLSSIDEGHLNKLKIALKSDAPLHKQKWTRDSGYESKCTGISIGSRKLTNALISHNIIPAKSLILQPSFLSEDLVLPYLRGIFDGDGCFHVGRRARGVSITGTYEICSFFCLYFEKYGLHFTWSKRHENSTNNFSVSTGGAFQTRKILSILYGDSKIHLDRKFEAAVGWIKQQDVEKNKINHYIMSTSRAWYYFFNSKRKKIYKGGFRTKQEAFSACENRMKELGALLALEKLRHYHQDCQSTL